MASQSENPGCLAAVLGLFGLRLEHESPSYSETTDDQPPATIVLPMPPVMPAPPTTLYVPPVVQPPVVLPGSMPSVTAVPLSVMPPVVPPIVSTVPPTVIIPPVQLPIPIVVPVPPDKPPEVVMPGYLPPLTSTADPNYLKRDSIFTYRERVFYGVLLEAIGGDYWTFAKVRLADFIWLPKDAPDHKFHNMAILCKHIDFLICERRTYRPLLGIELDDPTHHYIDSQKRDDFKNRTFATVGLPLMRVTMAQDYSVANLREQIRIMLSSYGAAV